MSRSSELLFLANIQPDLQREVREQCRDAHLAGLDSMNFWIENTRDALVRTIGGVDIPFMNDAALRMLTELPNLVRAARAVMRWPAPRPWLGSSTARRCSPRRATSRSPPSRSRR